MKTDLLLPKPQYMELNSSQVFNDPTLYKIDNIRDILSNEETEEIGDHLQKSQFKDEGYVLRTTDRRILLHSISAAGMNHGINTAKRIDRISDGKIPDLLIIDYPEFAIRGVSEGYYGIPWTWEARRDVIDICSKNGSNHYIFAPCDINLKANWRKPLDVEFKEDLEGLIKFSHEHHMKFVYEILPIGIKLSSEEEYKTLLERYNEVIELGVDGLMFSFDDTDDYVGGIVKTKKAARNQVNVTNKLLNDISNSDILLCFVPVEYYGTKDTSYLRVIGKELDPKIYVGWTGPKIRSDTVTVEDAEKYGELIGRKPFLGHNFPVVDEMDKKRRITVGPLMGLDSDLSEKLSGIGFNFMELPYASLISGMTCGDYAWNPKEYNPDKSIQNSCNHLGPNLMRLVELNPESYANPNGVHPLAQILKTKRLKDLTREERTQLEEIFNMMVNLDTIVAEGTDPRIYKEIRPWLNQGNITGALGNLILNGGIKRVNWKTKAYATLKMVSGYRLSGVVFEDWVLREIGFPASLFTKLPSLRLVGDFFERVARDRHERQKI